MSKIVTKQLLHVRHRVGDGLNSHKLAITWRAVYDDDAILIYSAVGLGQDLEVEVHAQSDTLSIDEEILDLEDLSVHPVSFDLFVATLYASRFIEVLRD